MSDTSAVPTLQRGQAGENATQTATRCSRRFSKLLKMLVGAGRFELPTPCSRSKCLALR